MKKLLMLLTVCIGIFIATSLSASGDKKNNPMVAATLDDGCVLVFADGIDETQCTKTNTDSTAQGGQQYICEILAVCGRDDD